MSEFQLIVPDSAVRLPTNVSDEDILDLVRNWVDALAAEDYQRAYGMTAHNPHWEFTADIIRQVIEGYGLLEPHPDGPFKVTDWRLAKATNGKTYANVRREDMPEDIVGEIWFNLPLNGEWSDLTAAFDLHLWDGSAVLCLDQIHVM